VSIRRDCGGQADARRLTAREGSGDPRTHGVRVTRSGPALAARSGHRSRSARSTQANSGGHAGTKPFSFSRR